MKTCFQYQKEAEEHFHTASEYDFYPLQYSKVYSNCTRTLCSFNPITIMPIEHRFKVFLATANKEDPGKSCEEWTQFDEDLETEQKLWWIPLDAKHGISPFYLWIIKLFRGRTPVAQKAVRRLHMNIGNGDEEDIHDFLRVWQQGMLTATFGWIIWRTSASRIDRRRLMSLLDVDYEQESPIILKQDEKPWMTGRLYHDEDVVRFICDKPKSRMEWIKHNLSWLIYSLLRVPKSLYKYLFGDSSRSELSSSTPLLAPENSFL